MWEGRWLGGTSAWRTAAAEFFWVCSRWRRLEWLNLPDPWTPPLEDLERTLDRFLQLEKVFPMDEYISGWFFGTPFEQVPKENVLEYVSYGMLYKVRHGGGVCVDVLAR